MRRKSIFVQKMICAENVKKLLTDGKKIGKFRTAKLLSDNDPTVPARSGEMPDSHIGPSGPCAGLRKMILRRK